jgi:hypothetical protein
MSERGGAIPKTERTRLGRATSLRADERVQEQCTTNGVGLAEKAAVQRRSKSRKWPFFPFPPRSKRRRAAHLVWSSWRGPVAVKYYTAVYLPFAASTDAVDASIARYSKFFYEAGLAVTGDTATSSKAATTSRWSLMSIASASSPLFPPMSSKKFGRTP